MPGAGGLVSLNHLGTAAPRDGTVITLIHVTVVQEGLFNAGATFDPGAFQWIGRLASLEFLGVASRKSGVRSLDDARKREVVVGAPGLNNVPAQSPLILNRIAGTKFKLISGYNGTGQTFIALERGGDGTLTDGGGFGAGEFTLRLVGIDDQELSDTFAWPGGGIAGQTLLGQGNFP